RRDSSTGGSFRGNRAPGPGHAWRASIRLVYGHLRRRRKPGARLELGQRLDLDVRCRGPELLELARAREDAAFERAHELIVGRRRRPQRTPQLGDVSRHAGEALVQLPPVAGDLARVQGDAL